MKYQPVECCVWDRGKNILCASHCEYEVEKYLEMPCVVKQNSQ